MDADPGISFAVERPLFWHDGSNDWIEAELPRREWIAVGYLLRRTLSVLVGVPGVSKSTLALAWAIALALGEQYHRLRPIYDCTSARKRVLVVNTEDDATEQKRRISSLLRQFGRQPSDLNGWLMRAGPERIGTLVEKDALTGCVRTSVGFEALRQIIENFRPDVLILDPMIELIGGINENDNADISAALSELRALASEFGMAILLVHHTRKGAVAPGDMDAARGASSLHGKVRQGLTLVGMSEEEATSLGIPADARRHYLRLDDGKASYAPLGAAQWFERVSIELDNGDSAPSLLPWQIPVDAVTPEIRAAVEAGISRGSSDGPWSATLSEKPRSVRQLMVSCGVTTADGQRQLLNTLLGEGYDQAKFKDPRHSKLVLGLRSRDGKPSTVQWEDDSDE